MAPVVATVDYRKGGGKTTGKINTCTEHLKIAINATMLLVADFPEEWMGVMIVPLKHKRH